VEVAGQQAGFWIDLYLGCTQYVPPVQGMSVRPGFRARTGWPDGQPFLLQLPILVDCFRVIEDEHLQIELERLRHA